MSESPGHVLAEPAIDAARELIAGLALRPWGQVAPSVYESARLVADAPWLPGHHQRIGFLLREQRPDGAWGPPEGYALVPTLSATDALLAAGSADADLLAPAGRGLHALAGRLLATHARALPDTPALDLIVPALVESINDRLSRLDRTTADRLPRPPLELPAGLRPDRLRAVRAAVAAGVTLPSKLAHFYELLDATPADAGPTLTAVGASPAATAAWLSAAGPDAGPAAYAFLRHLIRDGDGPVPCPTPITVFERAWVLGGLCRAGVAVDPPATVLRTLATATAAEGVATGEGLPTDADTTSVTLDALARLGHPADPASLWAYETAEGFCTWPGSEDGFSVTTNAHVLDAFGQHVAAHPDADARYHRTVDRLSAVLPAHQHADGRWQDRWHASPYYATACCVLALAEFGRGGRAAESIDRAARWVLDSQRPDGSWGRWDGTVEETAYALQVLLAAPTGAPQVDDAVARGHAYLHQPSGRTDPPLWYGKELYCPTAIVRAAVLAACRLASVHVTGVDRSVVDCGYQTTKTAT
ncbi:prenyltransferase/squalene oxidase repeat-containing protein [Micromonospora sp. NPDC005174]|uniref:prenyltransferase/squalene oxidase repeat-containing protein n=1 Tax=unclassified Micromonospora TaxID=2617518 RepID=UPI0033AF7C32